MSDISFFCPHCGVGLEAPEELRGELFECPACGKSVRAPAGAEDARGATTRISLPDVNLRDRKPPRIMVIRQTSPAERRRPFHFGRDIGRR